MRRAALSTIVIVLIIGCGQEALPPGGPASTGRVPSADNAPAVISSAPADGNSTVPASQPPRRTDNCVVSQSAVAETSPTLVGEAPALPAPSARPLRPVRRVVVDPGHGGAENTGATCDGVWEREVNLDVGLRLTDELRKRGLTVTITRTEDTFISLEDRAEVANIVGADLFISLHSNAASNPEASGIEVYYPTEIFRHAGRLIDDAGRAVDINTRAFPDGALAHDGDLGDGVTADTLALSRELARTLGIEIERAMTKELSTTSRGVKPAGFEVLRWTACPAVLVEMGFLTHDADRAKLADESYRARIAKALADAVTSYANLGATRK